MFHNLHQDVMATAARGHGMMDRIRSLDTHVSSIEMTLLSKTDHTDFCYNAGQILYTSTSGRHACFGSMQIIFIWWTLFLVQVFFGILNRVWMRISLLGGKCLDLSGTPMKNVTLHPHYIFWISKPILIVPVWIAYLTWSHISHLSPLNLNRLGLILVEVERAWNVSLIHHSSRHDKQLLKLES